MHFIHNKKFLWDHGRSPVLSGIGNRDEGSKEEVIIKLDASFLLTKLCTLVNK